MAMASTTPACAASEIVAKGRQSAAVLQAMLGQLPAVGAGATPHGLRDLAEQILRCCDRALAALQLHSATGTEEEEAACSSRKRKPEREGGLAAPPAATRSKRMRMTRGEKGTRVQKKGTMEDGFIWRKYGQKDIHGRNYPRLYFRCTYKDDRGCMARRQVQRSDADPSVYLITYFDDHTCCRDDDAVELPAPFVINFGLGSCAAGDDKPSDSLWPSCDDKPSGSPWPSCDDSDGGTVEIDISALCSSPEEEELPQAGMCNVREFVIEQSTPVPELMGMITLPEWDPMDGCLDWEPSNNGQGSFGIDDFVGYNFDYIDLLY